MREPVRDKERLQHILQAIDYAFKFSEGLTLETLDSDKAEYFAIVKNIEIIGEASYMLSKEFKTSHPDTEWAAIEGMRHFLVHGYYQVSRGKLWNVITKDLEPLKLKITEYLAEA